MRIEERVCVLNLNLEPIMVFSETGWDEAWDYVQSEIDECRGGVMSPIGVAPRYFILTDCGDYFDNTPYMSIDEAQSIINYL